MTKTGPSLDQLSEQTALTCAHSPQWRTLNPPPSDLVILCSVFFLFSLFSSLLIKTPAHVQFLRWSLQHQLAIFSGCRLLNKPSFLSPALVSLLVAFEWQAVELGFSISLNYMDCGDQEQWTGVRNRLDKTPCSFVSIPTCAVTQNTVLSLLCNKHLALGQ